MRLDTVSTAHTLALFLGSLHPGDAVAISVTPGSARVQVIEDNGSPVVERAAALLGVRPVWHARDCETYPVEYVTSGAWHGLRVTVFSLFTADGWSDVDVTAEDWA